MRPPSNQLSYTSQDLISLIVFDLHSSLWVDMRVFIKFYSSHESENYASNIQDKQRW